MNERLLACTSAFFCLLGCGDDSGQENAVPVAGAQVVIEVLATGGVVTVGEADLLVNASDADGDTLDVSNIQIASGDESGVVVDNSARTLTIDPFVYPAVVNVEVVYSFTIGDGRGGTVGSTVALRVAGSNQVPTASAGSDQIFLNEPIIVSLDCTGSSDPEGVALTYQWVQTSGATVTLSDATSCDPTFAGPGPASIIEFSLRVSDGVNESAEDTVLMDLRGYTGQVVDLGNPFGATTTYQIAANAEDIEVIGDYAYIAVRPSGLEIVDISTPGTPTMAGSVDSPGQAKALAVAGSYAYVADGTSGLQVIDISDPTNPAIVGTVDTPGNALDVVVAGGYAYVADGSSGLQVIDISDPSSPAIVGNLPGFAVGVAVVGDTAYVTDGESNAGLTVVNITTKSAPAARGSVDTPGGAGRLVLAGNYAYVADGDNGLQVVDVSDPDTPVLAGAAGVDTQDVTLVGNLAYVSNWVFGLRVIDVSNPNSLSILGGPIGTTTAVFAVRVVGDYAYVADGNGGFRIITVGTPGNQAVVGSVTVAGNPRDVVVAGNFAYAAMSGLGLQVIDISNPNQPAALGLMDTPGSAGGLAMAGSHVYVADGAAGLQVVDISDPTSPAIVGAVDTPANARNVMIVGDLAYVADGLSLQVVDISDPTSPAIVGAVDTPALDVIVVGTIAYVAADGSGLQVIDVTTPATPAIVGSVDTPGVAQALALARGHVVVADGTSGLQVVDVSVPSSPVIVGSVAMPGQAVDLVVVGTMAYVADLDLAYGLRVVDVSMPASPTRTGGVKLVGARALTLAGDYLYVGEFAANSLTLIDVTKGVLGNDVGVAIASEVLNYGVSWNLDGSQKLECRVSGGSCLVTAADFAGRTGTVQWTLPTAGDYEILITTGNDQYFFSHRDRVIAN